MKKQELKPMKKFFIREAETLKTTSAAFYGGSCDPFPLPFPIDF